ncbi:MarR family transcriptional regulator [Ectopseudomonas mendocina]|uniref:MarR family transcriptional regulator n=1 Tax=Ectopseudomonas mendocina TaxID=300 RepID=A0ABZ2RLW9_ECTME
MRNRAKFAMDQWSREKPNLPTLPMELIGQLAEAAQLITHKHLNPLYAEHGLQIGEFDVLSTLRRNGAPYALTPTALYDAAMISSGGMTNRIDRLEKAGFVERRSNPEDRRGTLVTLTPKGLELIDTLMELHVENEQGILKHLTESEQMKLSELLAKLIDGLPPSRL